MSAICNIDHLLEISAGEVDVEQGSAEWHALRKKKITATDANIIMGVSPWKTKKELYYEKLSNEPPKPPNARQQRGLDLEPVARDLFNLRYNAKMKPSVLVLDWAMASLDGLDPNTHCFVEIKCPGPKDHALAMHGLVPEHYYPQIQHQMWITGNHFGDYFSFDGIDGVKVTVERDEEYIQRMIEEEYKFHLCVTNKTPPEKDPDEPIQRNDDLWQKCASKWICLQNSKKELKKQEEELEKEEEEIRNQLIFLAGQSNSKGAGLSLSQVTRKGTIQYAKMPILKGVDCEPFRSPDTKYWKITIG